MGSRVRDRTHRSKSKRVVPRISIVPANHSPGKLVHDAHVRLSTGLVRALGEAGYPLTIDAWVVLNLLWAKDNLPQFEIGARIGRDRHQTSRLIDCLEQQELATRESTAADRRVKRVRLTPSGRSARVHIRRVATDYLKKTFTGVSQEDYDGFMRCLKHIIDRLEPTEP